MSEDIQKARDLLKTIRHAAMATVNNDGSPHNTPIFFMYNPEFTKIYWGSHEEALHSQNIRRTGKLFVTIFDSKLPGQGGIYITADNAHELSELSLNKALDIHNSFRKKYKKEPLTISYYQSGEQCMYSADIKKIEIYTAERDEDGRIRREKRLPVAADYLI